MAFVHFSWRERNPTKRNKTRAVLMHRPQGKSKTSTARLYSAYYTLIAGKLSDVLEVLEAMPHILPHNT